MGWNSWDSYGLTIDEADFRANTKVLAGMKEFGWLYSVIDEGWYMENPSGGSVEKDKYVFDGSGILIPALNRFPSAANGAGLKPLSDWVHKQGLKFGIHLVRGIPREVVKMNLPIAGTKFHAVDAADQSSPCPWDEGNWGIADNEAGQAYYDAMIKLYAGWGVDFLKVDCISDHPYRPTEIHQLAKAIRKSGRPILLSLSPGPTSLEHGGEVAELSQMWRISDDHWDLWSHPAKAGESEYPIGTLQAFDRLEKWFPYFRAGNWPDDDMLPLGYLGPHPGMGEARQSRLTQEEQKTEFTLWAISRSPLIVGANLTKMDAALKGMLTNQNILFMNQNLTYSRPVDRAALGAGWENARVWRGSINEAGARNYAEFFAFFNVGESPLTLHASWKQLGLDDKKHAAQDLWTDQTGKESKEISVTLAPHASAVYEVK